MGNCFPLMRKLPCLISEQDALLDDDCFDPDPHDLGYQAPLSQSVPNPMTSSVMSASFIESDERATELIRKLG